MLYRRNDRLRNSHRHCIYPYLLLVEVNHNAYIDGSILAPTNDNMNHINGLILNTITGLSHHLLSTDKVVTDDENMPDVVSVEYLNSVQVTWHTTSRSTHQDWSFGLFFFVTSLSTVALVNGKKKKTIKRGVSTTVS